jgi:GxxExxY protein
VQRNLTGTAKGSDETPDKLLHRELTGAVITSFFFTYNVLGFGFLESVYRKSLALELRSRGLHVEEEHALTVQYRDEVVGLFKPDLIIENVLAVELKATAALGPTDKRQLINYLKAGNLDVGLLLHYGPRPEFFRLVHSRYLSV